MRVSDRASACVLLIKRVISAGAAERLALFAIPSV